MSNTFFKKISQGFGNKLCNVLIGIQVVVTLIHKEIYDTISNNKKNQIPNRQYEAYF